MNRQLLNHMGLLHKQLYVGLCILAILTDSLARAQVNVEPNTAVLNEGDPTELLCRYAHHTITYCRIEIPGEPKIFNLSPEWNKTPGFTYFGKGLQAGECGVSIQRVKAINNGQVKCNLGVEGEELSGTIDLVVALRPKQPLIELIYKPDHEGYFSEDSAFKARCIVPEGRPAANITWYLDNEHADKTVTETDNSFRPNGNGLELSTVSQAIQWHLTPEDNGRKLICRSHHQTDRENLPPQEASYMLLVRYAPIRRDDISVYGLYLEHTATVNLTIRSNPAPVVEWTIDGKVVRQGEQAGRFSVYEPIYLGQDMYNVTLVIAGLTLEDTTKTYNLRAQNSLGTSDYIVRISSSATPPATGLEIGAIVGIVVAVAVLVLIVLLVLFARATGRWCFGGKSVKMSTNETSDTESADVKATSTATTATTAAVSELDANAPVSNESCTSKKSKRLPSLAAIFKRMNERDTSSKRKNNEQDVSNEGEGLTPMATATNEQQLTTEDTNTDGNDNQPKEDKQLVYAELVLKPAENIEPLPTKNSTEYAEIVYTKKDDNTK